MHSAGSSARVSQPSTLRMVICPEASSHQNSIAARRQHRLRFDAPLELFMQPLNFGAGVDHVRNGDQRIDLFRAGGGTRKATRSSIRSFRPRRSPGAHAEQIPSSHRTCPLAGDRDDHCTADCTAAAFVSCGNQMLGRVCSLIAPLTSPDLRSYTGLDVVVPLGAQQYVRCCLRAILPHGVISTVALTTGFGWFRQAGDYASCDSHQTCDATTTGVFCGSRDCAPGVSKRPSSTCCPHQDAPTQ